MNNLMNESDLLKLVESVSAISNEFKGLVLCRSLFEEHINEMTFHSNGDITYKGIKILVRYD